MKQEFQKTLSSVFKQKTEVNHKKMQDILERLDTPTAYLSSFDNIILVESPKMFNERELIELQSMIQAEANHHRVTVMSTLQKSTNFWLDCFPVIISFTSILFAGWTLKVLKDTLRVARDVPLKIAEEQKKVTLYDKKIDVYHSFKKVLAISKAIFTDMPHSPYLILDKHIYLVSWAKDVDKIFGHFSTSVNTSFYKQFLELHAPVMALIQNAATLELVFDTSKDAIISCKDFVLIFNSFVQNLTALTTLYIYHTAQNFQADEQVLTAILNSPPGKYADSNINNKIILFLLNDEPYIKQLKTVSDLKDSLKTHFEIIQKNEIDVKLWNSINLT